MGSEGYEYSSLSAVHHHANGDFYSPRQQTRGSRSNLAVVPCTVSQLRSAKEDHNGFTVGDTDPYMVSLVGLVRSVSSSVSCVLYVLDDMTGPPIQAKFWQETVLQEEDVKNADIRPGSYVRVTGRIRSLETHRSVAGLHIRRLEDLNEITSHILEVVQAQMWNRQALLKVHDTTVSFDNGGQQATGCQQMAVDSSAPTAGLSPIQNQVLGLIKSCSDHQGMSFSTLICRFTPQNAGHVRDCVQFLINEGHIYTTTDDNHFKATYG